MKKIFVFIVVALFLTSFVFAVNLPEPYISSTSGGIVTGGDSLTIEKSSTELNLGNIEVVNIGKNETVSNKFIKYSNKIKSSFSKRPSEWSNEEACLFMKGCYESPMCYPFGYVKDGKYCSDKLKEWGKIAYGFANQKSYDGDICENNFECKSNLCYGRECISPSEVGLVDYFNKKINELKERINFLEQQLDSKINNSIEEDVSAPITGGVISENSVERKGFFDWFKNLFTKNK